MALLFWLGKSKGLVIIPLKSPVSDLRIAGQEDRLHIGVNVHGWTSELFLAMCKLALVALRTAHITLICHVLKVGTHLKFVQVLVVH